MSFSELDRINNCSLKTDIQKMSFFRVLSNNYWKILKLQKVVVFSELYLFRIKLKIEWHGHFSNHSVASNPWIIWVPWIFYFLDPLCSHFSLGTFDAFSPLDLLGPFCPLGLFAFFGSLWPFVSLRNFSPMGLLYNKYPFELPNIKYLLCLSKLLILSDFYTFNFYLLFHYSRG